MGFGFDGSSGSRAPGEGTGIRFSLSGSGLRLLKGVSSELDLFSDESGGEYRGMHVTLRSALFASVRQPLVSTPAWRYSFYSPEMNLLSETELRTTAGTPAVLYEYVWFNRHPVAQVDQGTVPVTHWTFTDHLGTPIIQTSTDASVYWRAEYEPYGKVFALLTVDQHQPLRLPGQEAEQLNLGQNGDSERSFNIFRWYLNGWGRCSQPDPVGFFRGTNLFAYVEGKPLNSTDPTGLFTVDSSCLCGGPFNTGTCRATAAGARSVCSFFSPGFATRNPKCRDALLKLASYSNSYGVTPLSCMYRSCQTFTIKCVQGQGNCGGPPSNIGWEPGVVFIQKDQFEPHSGCGSVGNTIIHESLHLCGVPTERDSGRLAQEIATECFGN